MTTILTYLLTIILLLVSFVKNKEKTKQAFKVSKKAFLKTNPGLLTLIGFVGLTLGILTPETISRIVGESAGSTGTIIAAIVGGITLIPAMIAFPLADTLLKSGATIMTISAFVSTLVMVGAVTMPIEIKAFGKKFTILRNSISFILALLIAWIMEAIL